jgi:hypothetical protein
MDNDIFVNILGGNIDTTGYGRWWSASLVVAQWMTDLFYQQRNYKIKIMTIIIILLLNWREINTTS